MLSTTPSFIKNFLPGGVIPNRLGLDLDTGDTPINVPFAILSWDDGLDYCTDDEGNEVAYEDSPPGWFICGAFESREEAEEKMAKLSENGGCYMIAENQTEPLYEFCYIHSA